MLRWRSGFSQTRAWTGLRTDRQRDRRVSRQTGEPPRRETDRCLPQSVTRGVFRLACSTTQEMVSPDLWEHMTRPVRQSCTCSRTLKWTQRWTHLGVNSRWEWTW